MFGLTFEKLLIIGVIAVFLLGPERLPHYAAQLGRLVRSMRDMANGAKDRVKEEMGPDFDVDWRERASFSGYLRFHVFDAAGNRVEVMAPV